MYYPNDEMRVNSFHDVRIPSNAEYFARYGFATSPASQYSGDETSPMPSDKLSSSRDAENLLLSKFREEQLKNNNSFKND